MRAMARRLYRGLVCVLRRFMLVAHEALVYEPVSEH